MKYVCLMTGVAVGSLVSRWRRSASDGKEEALGAEGVDDGVGDGGFSTSNRPGQAGCSSTKMRQMR